LHSYPAWEDDEAAISKLLKVWVVLPRILVRHLVMHDLESILLVFALLGLLLVPQNSELILPVCLLLDLFEKQNFNCLLQIMLLL
jgi:hypothetical protein